MKTWFMCPRKWWLLRVAKIAEPPRHHFVVGHAVHSVAERYLSRQATTWEGLFPDGWDKGLEASESAWIRVLAEEAVSKGIWKSKPGITIEHPVAYLSGREFLDHRGLPLLAQADTFLDAKGVRKVSKLTRLLDGRPLPSGWNRLPPFVGFIDQLDLPDVEIVDHKSAKSKKYVLSPAKLAQDLQVLSYAATPLALRQDVTSVHVRHNVLIKAEDIKDPVYTVEADAPLEAVQRNWSEILQAAEDMDVARRMAPAIIIDGHPEERARNFHTVRSAIDMNCTRQACDAYSGCPFKDACFGRATIQQVTRRLDTPDISDLVRSRGVLANPLPQTRPRTGLIQQLIQEKKTMALSQPKPAAQPVGPKFAMHQQVYVRDPDNQALQYVCMVLNPGNPGVSDPIVAAYPNADIEPDTSSLPNEYVHQLAESALQAVPFVGATIVGYVQAIIAAGGTAPAWRPSASPRNAPPAPPGLAMPPLINPNAAPPETGIQTGDAPVKRPERDGKFGMLTSAPPPTPAALVPGIAQGVMQPGVGAALAAQATRVQAEQAATAPPPSVGYEPQVGDTVVVRQTDHSFWSKQAGKQATVIDVGFGDAGVDATIVLDGVEYPNVAASRFEFIGRINPPAPLVAPAPPAAPEVGVIPITFEALSALKGHVVCVKFKDSPNVNNGALEDVYQAEGGPALSMYGGKTRVYLAQVETIKRLDYADIPGAPKPKEKKVRAPRKSRDGSAVAAVAAIPGQQVIPTVDELLPPPTAPQAAAPVFVGAPQAPMQPLFQASEIQKQIDVVRAGLDKLQGMLGGK